MTRKHKDDGGKGDNSPSANRSPSDAPLKIHIDPCGDVTAQTTQQLTRPSLRAAVTAQRYSRKILGDLDLSALRDELSKQCTAVNNGDMKRPEAMLVSQAHALEAIFHELARVASLNLFENLAAGETCLRLALKAQSQCRATLETLSVIKNPHGSVAFVKQANIAHGPQQVNNGVSAPVRAGTGARENETEQSKLLEASNGERLDFGTPTTASGDDSSLEAVGAINGAKNGRG